MRTRRFRARVLPRDEAYERHGKNESVVSFPATPKGFYATRRDLTQWLEWMDQLEAEAKKEALRRQVQKWSLEGNGHDG